MATSHHPSHAPHHASRPAVAAEGWTLLSLSASARLASTGVIIAALWLLVLWALR